MGGIGYATGGIPDGIAQGTCGACFLAEMAGSARSSGKAIYSFCRVNSCYWCYGIYLLVYHYLPDMDHAAEGVVEELVIASDEAKSRFDSPTAF